MGTFLTKSLLFLIIGDDFMIQFFVGLFIGANISLFLYALILSGAKEDKIIEKEVNRE